MTPTVCRQRRFGKRASFELFRSTSRRLLGLLTIAVLAIVMGPRVANTHTSNTHDHHRCDEPAQMCCECGVAALPVTVQVAPCVDAASPILGVEKSAPAALTFSPEPPPPKR
jgi:hypothetical protein